MLNFVQKIIHNLFGKVYWTFKEVVAGEYWAKIYICKFCNKPIYGGKHELWK